MNAISEALVGPDDVPLAERTTRLFQEFAAAESAGGMVLLACTALALGWANSPWNAK